MKYLLILSCLLFTSVGWSQDVDFDFKKEFFTHIDSIEKIPNINWKENPIKNTFNLFNKKTLSKEDFDNIEDFLDYYEHEKNVDTLRINHSLRKMKDNNSFYYEYTFSIDASLKGKTCVEYSNDLIKILGDPKINNNRTPDAPLSETNFFKLDTILNSWHYKNTGISFMCMIITFFSQEETDMNSVYIKFSPIEKHKDQKQIQLIKCDMNYKYRFTDGTDKVSNNSIHLYLDEENNTIMNLNKKTISGNKTTLYSDDFIKYTITSKELISKISLNRISGNMLVDFDYSQSKHKSIMHSANASGSCEKLDIANKKF